MFGFEDVMEFWEKIPILGLPVQAGRWFGESVFQIGYDLGVGTRRIVEAGMEIPKKIVAGVVEPIKELPETIKGMIPTIPDIIPTIPSITTVTEKITEIIPSQLPTQLPAQIIMLPQQVQAKAEGVGVSQPTLMLMMMGMGIVAIGVMAK